jgi:uncharacterized protein (DUF1697 family)
MSDRPEGWRDWVVLLRGVNVGGKNRLPMAEWRRILAGQGFHAPQTLIQSGNAVFGAAAGGAETVAQRVGEGIESRFGFRPGVFVLTEADLTAALDHPFPKEDPTRLHAIFLAPPDAAFAADRAEALRAASESVLLRPGHLLLHAPDGIGRSKLAEALPRLFSGQVTSRNLRTVAALRDLMRSRQGEGTPR